MMTIDERIKYAITSVIEKFDKTETPVSIVSMETLPEQCNDRDVMKTNDCTLASIEFDNASVFIMVTAEDNYTIKFNARKGSLMYDAIRSQLINAVMNSRAFQSNSNCTVDIIDEIMGNGYQKSRLEKKIEKIYEYDVVNEQTEKIHNIIDSSYSVSEALAKIMEQK